MIAALVKLALDPAIEVSTVAREVLATPGLASAKPGFIDRLIHGTSRAEGHTLVTLEQAAKKLPGTRVLAALG